MRNVLLFALLLLLLGSLLVFLIPKRSNNTETITIHSSQNAVLRCLTETEKFMKWWPQVEVAYPSSNFSMGQQLLNSVQLDVPGTDTIRPAILTIAPLGGDSSSAIIQQNLPGTGNPLTNMVRLYRKFSTRSDFRKILQHLKEFAEEDYNVYGLKVEQVLVKDSVLVGIKDETPFYPSTDAIYSYIAGLRQFISSSGATEMDAPMLNIKQLNNGYQVQVAIPINKMITGKGKYETRRMVMGKLFTAEVKGGPWTVEDAMRQMNNFMYDYNKTAPAIPYQSLITDRSKEPDTSKWITRIYFPVM